ncbi:E3 ubiquitin-protein ligase NEURL1 [Antennarius striatus]|uniref:E3 ubiquitin-protein ligase NEURL1 n=1 Tax=Antennarius striatus TaxID=241820 RepID=UPI0035AF9D20
METSHVCDKYYLEPLSFHPEVVGDNVFLSHSHRLARRISKADIDSLVFSNRPVETNEKISLRVLNILPAKNEFLHVGFTNIPPSPESLPSVLNPLLNKLPGIWVTAAPLHDASHFGSKLEFWVNRFGVIKLHWKGYNIRQYGFRLLNVDLNKPLWAIVNIVGWTTAVYLIGSKKQTMSYTKRSCLAQEREKIVAGEVEEFMSTDAKRSQRMCNLTVTFSEDWVTSHVCNKHCLEPLTFHPEVMGKNITLSHSYRLAKRLSTTYCDGLAFSSRPVETHEKIILTMNSFIAWKGCLRVGFTNVPPSSRSLPLPSAVSPFLNKSPGHWVCPIPETKSHPLTKLQFWVDGLGTIWVSRQVGYSLQSLPGRGNVDLSKPLWAIFDLFGQTTAVYLIGSEKLKGIHIKRSCPVQEMKKMATGEVEKDSSILDAKGSQHTSGLEMGIPKGGVMDCVICMRKRAKVSLPCGHVCFCKSCSYKILWEFKTCLLCQAKT